MKKSLTKLLLLLVCSITIVQGCTDSCVIPDARVIGPAKVRLINAIPDFNTVSVYLNGKRINSALPYMQGSTDKTYYSSFEDNSSITSNPDSRLVVTAPNDVTDTLIDQKVSVIIGRQTFILFGRGHSKTDPNVKEANAVQLIEGGIDAPTDHIRARFVHAMPDLDSLDLYFEYFPNGDSIRNSHKQPNLRMKFGDTTSYQDLPKELLGLTVTESGKPDNIVAGWDRLPTSGFGLLATIVIRGETLPIANDATASTLILSDLDAGNSIFEVNFFYVRLANGLRDQKLHLMPQGKRADKGPRIEGLSGQERVFCVEPTAITEFWGLNEFYHGEARWFFGNNPGCPPQNGAGGLSAISAIDSFDYSMKANHRYTIVAVEKSLKGSGVTLPDSLVLHDTMSVPGTGFGRVRIVYVNPDHPTASFTLGSSNVTMNYRDVKYFDLPVGTKSFQLGGETISFTLRAGHPTSVYIFPANATKEYPFSTSED